MKRLFQCVGLGIGLSVMAVPALAQTIHIDLGVHTGSVGARVVYGPPPVYSVPHHPHAGPPVLDWQYARRQAKYEREAYKRWRKGQREHYKRAREFQREREKADREFERERIKDQREAAREYDRWRRQVEREQRRERRKRW